VKPADRKLGMDRRISRRDILHGVGALAATSFVPGTVPSSRSGVSMFIQSLQNLRVSIRNSCVYGWTLSRDPERQDHPQSMLRDLR